MKQCVSLTVLTALALLSAGCTWHPPELTQASFEKDEAINARLPQSLLAKVNTDPEAAYEVAQAYLQSDHADATLEAVKLIEFSARTGYAPAQLTYGDLFSQGRGVASSPANALVWWRMAAAQGNQTAMRHMGDAYFRGRGIQQDYAKAKLWYARATTVAEGDIESMLRLGRAFEVGIDEPSDRKKAAEWYEKAYLNGSLEGQYQLARLHATGAVTNRNYKKAISLYEAAAQAGYADAYAALGGLYAQGKGVAVDEERAIDFYEMAVGMGSTKGAYELATAYEIGSGVPVNLEKARFYYQLAAERGSPFASLRLGTYFEQGGDYNPTQAAAHYAIAANAGLALGRIQLADAFLVGKGVPHSQPRALELYEQAARQQDPYANYMASVMYRFGLGIQPDLPKSVHFFDAADVIAGNAAAKTRVGTRFLKGDGVPKRLDLAQEWFELAAKQGDPMGQIELGDLLMAPALREDQDPAQAAYWYSQAASQGHPLANYNLARLHYNGLVDGADKATALALLSKSAEQGAAYAQFPLGVSFEQGIGVEPSPVQAYAWLNISSKCRLEHMQTRLNQLLNDMSPPERSQALVLESQYYEDFFIPKVAIRD